MEKEKIKKVENNQEKYLSIKDINKKYNLAYKNEFYYECLFLTYALIEDRTKALLYHIGFLNNNREKVQSKKIIKESIIKILKIDREKPRYNFDKLYYRLNHIESIINWIKQEEDENDYEKEIKKVLLKYINNEDFINTINYLKNDWKDIRNELVHGLCNKKIEDASEKLREVVENGYNCFKIINKAVIGIKKNKIRYKFKIQ